MSYSRGITVSVGLSASQSFEPSYGDVHSCRLTKKRVSRVFIFLLSHLCLIHIIFTASLEHIIFIDTFSYATLLVLHGIHEISYVGVHLLWWHTMLICLQCEFIQLYWHVYTPMSRVYVFHRYVMMAWVFCWTSSVEVHDSLVFLFEFEFIGVNPIRWVSYTLSLINMWVRFINFFWMLVFLYAR